MPNGPTIDPSDMTDNQETMLGSSTFKVTDPTGDTVEGEREAVDASVNQAMVDQAPNLPFKLFGLERLFKKKNRPS